MDSTATAILDATDDAVVEAPETNGVEQELLVEDVSIDGMCGVY